MLASGRIPCSTEYGKLKGMSRHDPMATTASPTVRCSVATAGVTGKYPELNDQNDTPVATRKEDCMASEEGSGMRGQVSAQHAQAPR